MKRVVIVMGPPGMHTQKYAWLLGHMMKTKYTILNFDTYSWHKFDLDNYDDYFKEYCLKISNALKRMEENDTLILAGFFTIPEERNNIYNIINKSKVKIDEIIGIWLESSFKYLIEHNTVLEEATEELQLALFQYRVSPREGEPFKDIYYFTTETNLGLSKRYPYFDTIQGNLKQLAEVCDTHD